MATRIKIRISVSEYTVETSALVNSGYEADDCDIIIPTKLAEKLKLWPHLPEDTQIVDYETAGGFAKFYRITKPAEVKAITQDKETEVVKSNIIIAETEHEVLISDALSEELGIELLKLREGIWRFSHDPKGIVRKSEKRQQW